MDLSTSYCGIDLPHPLVVGASPLVDDLDTVRRLEDAGVAAIVMHSLFEEQIRQEQIHTFLDTELPAESFPEALSYFPEPSDFALGPDRYLEQVRRIVETVDVPVFGSLNGTSTWGWLEYARLIEQAGADGLELNLYSLATAPMEDSLGVERQDLAVIREVLSEVSIPVAVKLSPFYSSMAHFANQLDGLGVGALVIFNRFYQPDIDVEELEVEPTVHLSDSSELLLRLRWLAILYGQIQADLAVTGGVHTGIDAVKAVMAGAGVVQIVSCLLRNGVDHVRTIRDEMATWMEEHEYSSLRQMLGSMSLSRCADPSAFERANYMRILQSWRARDRDRPEYELYP